MSQAGLSNFNWPTAAPGAPTLPKFTLDLGSTVTFMEAAPTSSSLIHQTKPLDFQAPVRPTKMLAPVPEMTVAAFQLYTSADASVSILAEPGSTQPSSTSTPNTSASANLRIMIAGTVFCAAALILLIGLALTHWRARRSLYPKDTESAAGDTDAMLRAKLKQAQDLRQQRWTRCFTGVRMDMEAAQSAARDTTERNGLGLERARGEGVEMQGRGKGRRPSGLGMHPPTPVEYGVREGEGREVGRAV